MIGVFDSGHGGLTILRALVAASPRRSFLYLGDHALAPYGNRPPEEIYRLTQAAVIHLFERGCRLVVLACNTAAAVSLRRLQQEWLPHAYPDRRILGVLVPMVEAVTGVPWMADPAQHSAEDPSPRTVAVFATRQTVLSNAYPIEIGKRAPQIRVVQQACPKLVDLIEAGGRRNALEEAVLLYVGQLLHKLSGEVPDFAMLGCTHYPLIADIFAQALPPGVEILSQPTLVARSLEDYLCRHPQFDPLVPAAGGKPQILFSTTGAADRISELASHFFGHALRFEQVHVTPQDSGRRAVERAVGE